MAKTRGRTEFGDFQTPHGLALDVCRTLWQRGVRPRTIVEPTCGLGSFLLAALEHFPSAERIVGVDVNEGYLRQLEARIANGLQEHKITLVHADFFTTDWLSLLQDMAEPILVLGNPPWVTNAELGSLGSENLPEKSNFQNRSGLDAVTGKSNFDISEWMLLQVLGWLDGRHGTMAMLCKTAVARKLLRHAWKHGMRLSAASLFGIDATHHFGASVDACLLVCKFSPSRRAQTAAVHASLDTRQTVSRLGWRHGAVVADADAFDRWESLMSDQAGTDYVWRSGVKHDCSRVMELVEQSGRFRNQLGQWVDIEPKYVFPMLKGSDVARGNTAQPTRRMIVTQSALNSDTATIRTGAPKTWGYLESHGDLLDGRKSSIYRNRPRFVIFGVGPYTFAPYKVAICGLYKRLHFEVVGKYRGKPIVFDDTVYFLACRTRREARLLADLLNSDPARAFYGALTFWDAKRPITADLLRRLDLTKLARYLGYDEDLGTGSE